MPDEFTSHVVSSAKQLREAFGEDAIEQAKRLAWAAVDPDMSAHWGGVLVYLALYGKR